VLRTRKKPVRNRHEPAGGEGCNESVEVSAGCSADLVAQNAALMKT
jgi:hypothetical protein